MAKRPAIANDNAPAGEAGQKKLRPCPICGKPAVAASQPFCSARCTDIDLHRWLGGIYAIGSDADMDDSIAPSGPE